MTWDGLRGDGVDHRPSPLESRRFGLSVGRVVVGVDTRDAARAAADLTGLLKGAAEEVLIVRWPSELVGLGAAAAASGRTIIPADVLTYWEVKLGEDRGAPVDMPGLEIVRAPLEDPATPGVVADIVTSSFRDYGSHYAANPLFDRERALAGYVEWAQSCLTDPGKDVLLLKRHQEMVGVATLEAGAGGDLEILLCGLAADAQGQGLYRQLLDGVVEFGRERGHERVIISTQAQNVRAQRVWTRAGLRPFAAVTTVHALSDAARSALWDR